MSDKFVREKHLVELLLPRLDIGPAEYLDPNAELRQEIGIDVVVICCIGRVGVQVTELDTGSVAGSSRREEKRTARETASPRGVYGTWAQNDPATLMEALQRSVSRKARIIPTAGFDQVWLLISCGVPEIGSLGSTFIMSPWLDAEMLNAATGGLLEGSKYHRVFVHVILGVEQALYEWSRVRGAWVKTVQPDPCENQAPTFFELQEDQESLAEWLADPDGKTDREVEKVLEELRAGKRGL